MYTDSLIANIAVGIKENWNLPALSDYKKEPIYYREVAQQIAKLHLLFEQSGIEKGDKIVLCGRNCSAWAVIFFATITYGAVAVPLLHEFKSDSITHLVNHSDGKILFVGDVVWEGLIAENMPKLSAIVQMQDFDLVGCNDEKFRQVFASLDSEFAKKYPNGFSKEDVNYKRDDLDTLALINYTSGTTSISKGVMLSYRSLLSNYMFACEFLPNLGAGNNVISMLPMAHMYGLQFEVIFEFIRGIHIHFLTRIPSPKIVAEAFARVKPDIIISVPLIIEKIYKSKLKPILDKKKMKLLLRTPIIDTMVKNKILEQLTESFGGKFYEIIVGGSAFNREVETFFKKIGFPHTVGYGMTECGPIICYSDWKSHKLGSCGKVVPRMELKIDSADETKIAGEILVKGANVMMGYYKNEEATKAVLGEDGWLRTGDLGIKDKDGNVYIKGRSKNMILGPSGQNIYPEEIEDLLNSIEFVNESLVKEEDGKLVALVYLDQDYLDTKNIVLSQEEIKNQIKTQANQVLSGYEQLSAIYLQEEEFEKTPKRSIKRYIYMGK
ncbi:MAG: AMP-binding protein [Bacteroidales bacterium]|nr:AMP-binding protein [Bacteroidales bacterium]